MQRLKSNSNNLLLRLRHWAASLRRVGLRHNYAAEEQPLRSALFSADQMEQHGRTLADSHRLAPGRTPDHLLTRLAANESVLIDVGNLLTAAVTANRRITPAGEWLLDNFYLIEEQIRTARRHLPKGYSRELPRLARGPSAGLPRVYDLALETISHGDGRVDPGSLSRFVSAYQSVTALKLGELWAIPIMLRLALIENLRRVAVRVAASMIDRDLADAWADQMTLVAEKDPKSLILVIADMARSQPPMTTEFVSEFARRLQGQSAALALPLTWIEQLLAESHQTIEQMVQAESQKQASGQVSISNSIASLRFLGAMDWRKFVESMSLVEQTLRRDPYGLYGAMDFITRDRYRHAIETVARKSGVSERDVAEKAIDLATAQATRRKHEPSVRVGNDDPDVRGSVANGCREAHVGFFLVDKGLPLLVQDIQPRPGGATSTNGVRGKGRRLALGVYMGAIALVTLLLTGAVLAYTRRPETADWLIATIGILSLLATSQFAVALVNWLATLVVVPHPLPRMDFSAGIPPASRTLVVIPAMLTSGPAIETLVEALEVRFLANRDANLYFGLLTDFSDAAEETLADDERLLQLAAAQIAALNRKYSARREDSASDGAEPTADVKAGSTESEVTEDEVAGNDGTQNDAFFLFHRPRRWNAREKCWMGYERKRGKLSELNALLRGGSRDCFSRIVGDLAALADVKYVITLDTDTQLPRDSARQFVGTMAHPLNHAVHNPASQRITDGYSILQPRVAVSLPGTNRSRYARLFGSEPGIDPYTRAVSDVYQDVFGEGSFIGKGIYDIDAFERALSGCFPENRILSHDLLEGCYARSALLSDVQLYEEYPASYRADVSRRHRWIRGDWQIASWLLARVPAGSCGDDTAPVRRPNPLSTLSQWKILDNLRRSLAPAALTLLLLIGWGSLSFALFWTLVVIGIILMPPWIATALDLFRRPDDVQPGQHLASALRTAGGQLAQAAFVLACLPYEAYYSLDAIVRTNWRIIFSKRKLLEWTPSQDPPSVPGNGPATGAGDTGLAATSKTMWFGPALGITAMFYLFATSAAALVVVGPVLILWIVSPVVAWWLSRPLVRRDARLATSQIVFLQKSSRKTWSFFETFVGPEDHWLPPDNYQEQPVAVIAHRTSPTNMGLSLLANLAAYDFGYIGSDVLLERTAGALETMAALPRYEGHFYNWYDTLSLQPLAPLYVSAVDSGNLAGHLLTLRPGLLAVCDDPIGGQRLFEGLLDTLRVLIDTAQEAPPAIRDRLGLMQVEMVAACRSPSARLADIHARLMRLTGTAGDVAVSINQDPAAALAGDLAWWSQALADHCQRTLADMAILAPWLGGPPAPGAMAAMLADIPVPTLRDIALTDLPWLQAVEAEVAVAATQAASEWLGRLRNEIDAAGLIARARMAEIGRLTQQTSELANMEYDFLYDRARHLLAIGYNVSDRRQDLSYYDMLASEARLCSFVAIAQGKLPQESWFALGRLLTSSGGEPTLLSWSGSMFEYLMPLLVMPTYEHTLLDRTYQAAVDRQIAYGIHRNVAWGISESAYNTVDAALNYQYRAFGVPGLGLKRGLADDLVVAPYASALALMVAPEHACQNLQRLAGEGLAGKYGFYEAVDYTAARLPRGQTSTVIRSFMAHHQGMIFLSLAYLLLDRPMQKRFESDPMFQATTLLLQERVPKTGRFQMHIAELSSIRATAANEETPVRVFTTPGTATPEVQLLSNSHYHVMVTNAGGGYSRWKDLAVTRWREDTTTDNWGTFCYLRDLSSGEFWSNTHQPTLKRAESYEAIFSEGRAEFRRRDHDYRTHTEIVVSPEDDIELRRVRITNCARVRRTIEVTSYAEVLLATPAADALHPAFSNLFIQTEIVEARQAILCTRRPRSQDEQAPWMFHLMAVHGAHAAEVSYETDRSQFIGRGNTLVAPLALTGTAALSGSQGSVLDPIVAIRYRIVLDPEQSATIDMVSGVAESRALALGLVEKYQDRRLADRVFELAWTHSQVVLRQINATEADAQLYARLANSVIYANASLRADPSVLLKKRRGQSSLWGYAISGDLPIVLLQIGDPDNIDLVRQMVQAHAYWRLKGLVADLVIWNEDRGGYRQALQEQIMGLIAAGIEAHVIDRPGGIFVRSAEHLSEEDRILFASVARAIISDQRGALGDQINRRGTLEVRAPHLKLPRLKASRRDHADIATATASTPSQGDLLFDNALGGFSADGREYVITTTETAATPAPWVNVLANAEFGTVVSESGMAYTWSENAHEFRLSPWHNDPVTDASGEACYLRDEDSGQYWSPAPLPCRGAGPYVTRHGFGYSIFEHVEDGIRSSLTVFVSLEDAVKFSVLTVRNESGRVRKLSAFNYVEWVLGDLRPKTAMHVITEIDPSSGALYARNAYNSEFAGRIAFVDVDDMARTVSGDRAEFIGRNGTLATPAALSRTHLSNKVGAALDPCAAIHVTFELADGEERVTVFRLGSARNLGDARQLLQRNRGMAAADEALEKVREYWRHTLGAVQVTTPDAAVNVLANGWLVYQTLACRVWARSGYYQSGGAFGFRDQLQDVMALIHTKPQLVRRHLLLCASRQFHEGDVQHWWHPPAGRGVRTHCSDDYLWLPLAACRYVSATGDTGVLDEPVHFLEGRPVNPGDDSYYDLPARSDEATSLYQHCVRAIEHGLTLGEHGLPLIGSGDWNDGMNMVGKQGKGESIWLGFFLCEVLSQFSRLAGARGDSTFAMRCDETVAALAGNIEKHGWDGEWYRRAYFDDGTPLGSTSNIECRIDSIAQSWSVLSGAGDAARSRIAMNSLDTHLVRRKDGIIQLLDPPFDTAPLDPGYIRGYVPGVRENGGQYTHGAIWAAMAFAALGDSARAWELATMINPVNHARTPEEAARYKVEPYVISADVYALAPHTGRGGWSWYTGSAGWMYRLILESLLGLRLEGDHLHIAPCIPRDWPAYQVHYRYRETLYHINVEQSPGSESGGNPPLRVRSDGIEQIGQTIPMIDDRQDHTVDVSIFLAPERSKT